MFSKEKHCSKCGQSFDCGGLLGCWCWSVKLDAAARAALRAQFADCLCRECLAQMAGGTQVNDQPSHR